MALYDIAAGLRPLDLGRTLAQVDAMQANRLQADALRQQLTQGQEFQAALAQHGQGAGRGEEGALLALARTPQGFQIAAPLLRERRQNAEADTLLRTLGLAPGANAPAVAQGSPPVGGTAPGYANRVAQLESPTGAPNAAGSGATGPYQIMPATRAGYPAGTPDDAILASETSQNANALRQGLGREPTQAETFLAHRLGAGGALAVLRANPNAPLTEVLAPVFDGSGPGRPPLQAVLAQNPNLGRAGTAGALVQQIGAEWGGQPAAGGAPEVSRGTGLPPGINATTLAALAASGNPRLQAVAQILAPMMRQADAPDRELVQVVGPNGGPVLVPRAQAVGRTPYISGQDAEPYRPMTPDERRQYGVPNNVSAAIGTRTNRPLISGPGQQNFNMGEREADKQAGAAFETAQAAAASAGRRAPIYSMMDAALAEFRPGVDANARIAVGQGLRALGIRTAETSQGEVLRALQRRLELAVTPQGQGAITENERTLIRDQVNVLGSTPEGARMLLQAVRQLDDYDRRFATILTDEVRKAGGQISALVMADARERASRELGPPLTPDVQSAILAADRGEPSATPANGPGGQGSAEPPAAAPVRVRTPAEAQQLQPGTIYIAPDGQTRRR